MSRRKTTGRPPTGSFHGMTGVAMSTEMMNAARVRTHELNLDGNLSQYIRGLIKQELHYKDWYDRMKNIPMGKEKQ